MAQNYEELSKEIEEIVSDYQARRRYIEARQKFENFSEQYQKLLQENYNIYEHDVKEAWRKFEDK